MQPSAIPSQKLKTTCWLLFCFAVLYVTVVLFSYSPIPFFKRYLSFLSDLGYSPLATGLRIKIYRAGYHIARVLDVVLCLLITVRAWRYYKKRSRFLLFPGENEWLQPFSDSIRGNRSLLHSLPLVLRASSVKEQWYGVPHCLWLPPICWAATQGLILPCKKAANWCVCSL